MITSKYGYINSPIKNLYGFSEYYLIKTLMLSNFGFPNELPHLEHLPT